MLHIIVYNNITPIWLYNKISWELVEFNFCIACNRFSGIPSVVLGCIELEYLMHRCSILLFCLVFDHLNDLWNPIIKIQNQIKYFIYSIFSPAVCRVSFWVILIYILNPEFKTKIKCGHVVNVARTMQN